MEMRYFWILDCGIKKLFDFLYHPGIENLADYPSKHHTGAHHIRVHPYYVHTPNSPRYLIRAAKPSVWRVDNEFGSERWRTQLDRFATSGCTSASF